MYIILLNMLPLIVHHTDPVASDIITFPVSFEVVCMDCMAKLQMNCLFGIDKDKHTKAQDLKLLEGQLDS